MPTPTQRRAGTTLWELLCSLSIASLLLAVGVPSFQSFLLDARQRADINAFFTAIQLARSETTKLGRPVVLCKSIDLRRCGGEEIGYDSGWMVFVNRDDRKPFERAESEPLLTAWIPKSEGPIHANRTVFEFRAFRRRSTNGTVTFCDRRGAPAARAVIVSYTGRPRIDSRGPGRRALICAGLP
jgi:type IV fimbrial biogenesis protein FimT